MVEQRDGRVLMIAFHFPPLRGSSGLQRTLKFAQYLPEFGWQPRVLTVHPQAYPATSGDQLGDIRPDVVVRRAFAWDAARHLSIRGAYPRWLALPDRWTSWQIAAIPAALWDCLSWRPDVIWSTFPIATAHAIGHVVHRMTRTPWVADLRDTMTEEAFPVDKRVWRAYRGIEGKVVRHASAVVFTTPGACRMYSDRYQRVPPDRWHIIRNGYDEGNFAAAEQAASDQRRGPKLLVHSGLLDPVDRDPMSFFDALSELKIRGTVSPDSLQVILRSTGHDATYAPQIAKRDLQDIVQLAPPLPYTQALAEMMHADALLLFQAANCNLQIPAKLYEYFRARRPILCITDPAGDTAAEARAAGIRHILHIGDRAQIGETLRAFLAAELDKPSLLASEAAVFAHSRRNQARQLAELFQSIRERQESVGD